eukprot:13585674-Alexandrium_andersonii.AAC.1
MQRPHGQRRGGDGGAQQAHPRRSPSGGLFGGQRGGHVRARGCAHRHGHRVPASGPPQRHAQDHPQLGRVAAGHRPAVEARALGRGVGRHSRLDAPPWSRGGDPELSLRGAHGGCRQPCGRGGPAGSGPRRGAAPDQPAAHRRQLARAGPRERRGADGQLPQDAAQRGPARGVRRVSL